MNDILSTKLKNLSPLVFSEKVKSKAIPVTGLGGL
jgi:hypothetical protein